MRKVKAVSVPELQDFKGILFCSIRGAIPLAAILAGGGTFGRILPYPLIDERWQITTAVSQIHCLAYAI